MNRRRFVTSTLATTSGAAAVALTGAVPQTAAAAGPPALMKLGCQSAPTNETHLKYFARYGVRNICGYPTIAEPNRLYATVDELKSMKDLAAKYGVSIDCIAPAAEGRHSGIRRQGVDGGDHSFGGYAHVGRQFRVGGQSPRIHGCG